MIDWAMFEINRKVIFLEYLIILRLKLLELYILSLIISVSPFPKIVEIISSFSFFRVRLFKLMLFLPMLPAKWTFFFGLWWDIFPLLWHALQRHRLKYIKMCLNLYDRLHRLKKSKLSGAICQKIPNVNICCYYVSFRTIVHIELR